MFSVIWNSKLRPVAMGLRLGDTPVCEPQRITSLPTPGPPLPTLVASWLPRGTPIGVLVRYSSPRYFKLLPLSVA